MVTRLPADPERREGRVLVLGKGYRRPEVARALQAAGWVVDWNDWEVEEVHDGR